MNENDRKIIGVGIHNLDEAETTLSRVLQISLATEGAQEKLSMIIDHTRIAGFSDPPSKEGLASKKWLMERLTENPDMMQVLAAGAYCGLWKATISLAERNNA